MANIKRKRVKTLETETIISIDDTNLIDLLKQHPNYFDIDFSYVTEIFVEVPGGGDWSNMNLDIGKDQPIQIVLKSKEVSEDNA